MLIGVFIDLIFKKCSLDLPINQILFLTNTTV